MAEQKKTEEPLDSQVLEWLRKGGFPLELRVGRLLQKHGWRVHHAKGYRDPVTEKAREIDLVATRALVKEVEGKKPSISLNLVIECKTSLDKPWILFHNPENYGAMWATLIGGEEPADTAGLMGLGTKHQVRLPWPFDTNPILAHGAVRAFTTPKEGDPTGPYSACQGVLTATRALAYEPSNVIALLRLNTPWLHMWAPLVVVAGQLFCYSLDTDGAEQLERIEAADVLLPSPTETIIDRVPVISEASLPETLATLTSTADQFLATVISDLKGLQEIAERTYKRHRAQSQAKE